MTTIPASDFVAITPAVLSAGGSALVLNGVILTTNTRVPLGANGVPTISQFATPAAVGAFFGLNSVEYTKAQVYFGGFTNSNVKPGNVLFAQYPATAVSAYLRGGNISGVALATLQALTGSLTAVMDGYSHVISSISLASYNSQSAMATAITAAFTDPTEASFTAALGASFTATAGSPSTKLVVTAVTGLLSPGDVVIGTGIPASTTIVSQDSGGTPGGAGTYNLSAANTASAASCTSTSTVLNVTIDTDDNIAVGQTLVGTGVTGAPVITAKITGTGGIGTYQISGTGFNTASESMTAIATAPVVTYDSVSGAFVVTSGITGLPSTAAFATGTLAAPLLLTSVTGAVLSQGAAAATPNAYMSGLVNVTQNWATFTTAFNPDTTGILVNRLAFMAWTSSTNNRYAYICFDSDASPTVTVPATGSLGYAMQQAAYSGTTLIWEPSDQNIAPFICGSAASIDFAETNGRITFKFKSQAGLPAGVTDQTTANNLRANGYNFYGNWATADENFMFFADGTVSGKFQWLDAYINQIQLNNALQLALVQLLVNTKSVPYNPAGYALIEAACADPINAALNFGSIRPNVPLSAVQIAEVNAAAGIQIDNILSTRGWYLQVLPATAQVRAARGTPPITFWYMDGGALQQIDLASILIQ